MIRLFAVSMMLLILLPQTAQAQNNPYNQFLKALGEVNRIDPKQNPEYETSENILKRKMVDNTNKVVGEVQDVILNGNGAVSALAVDFDRIHLSNEVYLNYRDMDIEPAGKGYELGFRADQIKEMYPDLLANIESAAGDDADNFSLKKMIGAPVRRPDGTNLGTIENVMFGSEGSWAEALYISLSGGNLRGRTIAIPYGLVEFRNRGDRPEVVVSKEQGDAIVNYVRDSRR